jgi:hypothetical protein
LEERRQSQRLLGALFPAICPISFHSLRNFLPFLGVHRLPAPALATGVHDGHASCRALQFLQRGNHSLEFLFLRVKFLYGLVQIHNSTSRHDKLINQPTDVTSNGSGILLAICLYREKNGQRGTT